MGISRRIKGHCNVNYTINPGTANSVPSVLTFNGPTAGTTTFNGMQSLRKFGGVQHSSMTITEVTP